MPLFLQEDIAAAARQGSTKQVIEQLKAQIVFDVNLRTVFQSSLLHLAARHNHLELAAELIKYGADIHALDYGGMRRSPLHWAIHEGSVDMVELLIDSGADPNFWCSQDQLERETSDSSSPQHSNEIHLALYKPSWTPELHYLWPDSFKHAVRLLLLSNATGNVNATHKLTDSDPDPGIKSKAIDIENIPVLEPAVQERSRAAYYILEKEQETVGEGAEGGQVLMEKMPENVQAVVLPQDVVYKVIQHLAYPISAWL